MYILQVLLCRIVRMHITPRESIRKIVKDILNSKAGEEKASDVYLHTVEHQTQMANSDTHCSDSQ